MFRIWRWELHKEKQIIFQAKYSNKAKCMRSVERIEIKVFFFFNQIVDCQSCIVIDPVYTQEFFINWKSNKLANFLMPCIHRAKLKKFKGKREFRRLSNLLYFLFFDSKFGFNLRPLCPELGELAATCL